MEYNNGITQANMSSTKRYWKWSNNVMRSDIICEKYDSNNTICYAYESANELRI